MYKKYVHPCYDFYNEQYKQVDDKTLVSSKGTIVSIKEIEESVKHDEEKLKSGEYETKLPAVGFLDSTEQEFISKVYERFEELHKNIVSTNIEIAKLRQLTGVYYLEI